MWVSQCKLQSLTGSQNGPDLFIQTIESVRGIGKRGERRGAAVGR